jgi:hypothetical protein
MFPLEIPDFIEQVIVTAAISIAAIAIVRTFFRSRKPKSTSCHSCDIEH